MRVLESEYQIKQLQQQSLVNRQRSFFVILLVLVLLLLGLLSAFSWFKLRKNNEELQRLNREKDKVLRVVAHDLRNPVAAIYSISEMEIESAPTPAEKDAWLMVRKACSGALELIREMLDVTSLQNSKTPKPQLIAVNLLLQDAINLIQHRATEKEIKIHFEGLSIPKFIHVAIDPMLRVIVNLLSNAIKFSENGKSIQMKAELNEAGLLITVIDQGIGIPQAVQGKVFDSFTTARRSGTAGEAAFGLGLSIVKEIVERHNGKVWFISREGEGSTFYIQLPTQLLYSSQEGLPDEVAG
jgi:signal transduction histidine kinase